VTGPESYLQRDCSEETARKIDTEVKKLLDRAYAEARETLAIYKHELELVTAELLKRETLDGRLFYKLIGREFPKGAGAQKREAIDGVRVSAMDGKSASRQPRGEH
jgi:cell division protease FtsH